MLAFDRPMAAGSDSFAATLVSGPILILKIYMELPMGSGLVNGSCKKIQLHRRIYISVSLVNIWWRISSPCDDPVHQGTLVAAHGRYLRCSIGTYGMALLHKVTDIECCQRSSS